MKIKASLSSLTVFGAVIASCVMAQDHGKMEHGNAKSTDSRFAMEAASGGLTEVAIGKLATEKASSQAVKTAGQKLVDDHTKANEELKTIASSKSMTLPTAPVAKDQAMIDKMQGLSGADFDKAFVSGMAMDHKKDIALFTKESNAGQDSEIKAFAAKQLPILKEHAKMISSINAK